MPLFSARKVISPKTAPTNGRSAPSVRSVSLPNSQSSCTRPVLIRDMTLTMAPTPPALKQSRPIPAGLLKSFALAIRSQARNASTTIGTMPSSTPPT
jgi:hypothetical protein